MYGEQRSAWVFMNIAHARYRISASDFSYRQYSKLNTDCMCDAKSVMASEVSEGTDSVGPRALTAFFF